MVVTGIFVNNLFALYCGLFGKKLADEIEMIHNVHKHVHNRHFVIVGFCVVYHLPSPLATSINKKLLYFSLPVPSRTLFYTYLHIKQAPTHLLLIKNLILLYRPRPVYFLLVEMELCFEVFAIFPSLYSSN
jgi:hypothetical protein